MIQRNVVSTKITTNKYYSPSYTFFVTFWNRFNFFVLATCYVTETILYSMKNENIFLLIFLMTIHIVTKKNEIISANHGIII